MFVLSVFLMVPVAVVIIGLCLDRVMDAVESRHYVAAGPTRRVSLGKASLDALGLLALIAMVNLCAVPLYLVLPFTFWLVNGILLGREYFNMVAIRRIDRCDARALGRKNHWQIWLTGIMFAVPLSVPVLNLLIPILAWPHSRICFTV